MKQLKLLKHFKGNPQNRPFEKDTAASDVGGIKNAAEDYVLGRLFLKLRIKSSFMEK